MFNWNLLKWNQENQEAAFRAIDDFRAHKPIQPEDSQALKTRFYAFLLLGVFLGNIAALAYCTNQSKILDYICDHNYSDETSCMVFRAQLECPTCTLTLFQFNCPQNTTQICTAVILNYSNRGP